MAVTIDDVRHIATLARLGLTDERATSLVGELNMILQHMEVLSSVDTNDIEPVAGVGATCSTCASERLIVWLSETTGRDERRVFTSRRVSIASSAPRSRPSARRSCRWRISWSASSSAD